MNTKELLERWVELLGIDEKVAGAVMRCIATRGKNKGYIAENPKPYAKDPLAWIAWQGLVSNLSGNRVRRFSLMASLPSEITMFKQIEAASKVKVNGLSLGEAINFVEPVYRWNTLMSRYNREASLRVIARTWGMNHEAA